jgi:hypothetical protein
MSIPAWILEICGAVMLLVAEVSAGQLIVARAWTRPGGAGAGIAVSRLLTGIALASLLVPGFRTLPNAVWAPVFGVVTACFAWRLWRESRGHGAAAVLSGAYAPNLVHSAAMLYLFAALPGPSVAESGVSTSFTGGMPGMPGMAGGSSGSMAALHTPTLALVFALLLIAAAVRDLDRQAGLDGHFPVAGRRLLPGGPTPAAAAGPVALNPALLLSPAVVKGCQVATGIIIAFVLIIMI